jgi:hypothetical protein
MVDVLSLERQQILFDATRGEIDQQLRGTGLGEVLSRHGHRPDTPESLIVVGVERVYYTEAADTDRDFDPLAGILAVQHEIGVAYPSGQSFTGLLVREGLYGSPLEPAGIGIDLTDSQLAAITAGIQRLQKLRLSCVPRHITKTLRAVTPSGQ